MLFSYPRGDLLGEVPPLQMKPKLFVGLDVFLLYVAIMNVIRCDNLSCCVHPINIMLWLTLQIHANKNIIKCMHSFDLISLLKNHIFLK